MTRAAVALHEVTGETAYVEQAKSWVAVLDRHYWDQAGGGYFFTADDTTGQIVRTKTASDNAVPAGNGTMVGVLTQLHIATGDDAYRRRAEEIVTLFSGDLQRNFFPLSTLINNAETLHEPLQVVIAGGRGDPATEALLRTALGQSLPDATVRVVPPDSGALPPGHPAHGKGLVGGRPAAYVCRGPVCSLPITDPAQLETVLKDE